MTKRLFSYSITLILCTEQGCQFLVQDYERVSVSKQLPRFFNRDNNFLSLNREHQAGRGIALNWKLDCVKESYNEIAQTELPVAISVGLGYD